MRGGGGWLAAASLSLVFFFALVIFGDFLASRQESRSLDTPHCYFTSGGQRMGASASASVLPGNVQD